MDLEQGQKRAAVGQKLAEPGWSWPWHAVDNWGVLRAYSLKALANRLGEAAQNVDSSGLRSPVNTGANRLPWRNLGRLMVGSGGSILLWCAF
jgi:hypothetical protein